MVGDDFMDLTILLCLIYSIIFVCFYCCFNEPNSQRNKTTSSILGLSTPSSCKQQQRFPTPSLLLLQGLHNSTASRYSLYANFCSSGVHFLFVAPISGCCRGLVLFCGGGGGSKSMVLDVADCRVCSIAGFMTVLRFLRAARNAITGHR